MTGTPGTGKTTIAAKLKSDGYKTINLFEFAKKYESVDGFDEERQAFVVDTEKLESVLANFLASNQGLIILEGHYGEIVPEKYVNKCFVLSCPTGELRLRLSKRGYPPDKIEENLTAEITQECWMQALEAFGPSRVTKINNMSISSTANLIETYLHVNFAKK
ncbi:MAG: AAA family ATPase [Candidatus Kariarchaeaceae archaeon]